jgi:acetolactate synthase small subunit
MSGIYAQVQDKLLTIEQNIEQIEKQIASLVLGYGEQAVFMEALVAQVTYSTDEARNKFHEDLNKARRQMLEVMQDASKEFLANDDQNIAATITEMVGEKLSDATE